MQETCTVWVCRDCMLHHANGECGNCHADEGHDRVPMSLCNPWEVAMGMLGKEHPCTEWEHGVTDECDCETQNFSWSSCDGCGSNLGGERHAMTLWFNA